MTSQARREVAEQLRVRFEISERRASSLASVHRSTLRYRRRRGDDVALRRRLIELAELKPCYGYEMLSLCLRREGWVVNHKRVLRLYREERLAVRSRKRKKHVASGFRVRASIADQPNQRWSMDFVHDRLIGGRGFRVLTVLDEGSREGLAVEADLSISGERVVRELDAIGEERGLPVEIWIDNGPEFRGKALDAWAARHGVRLCFIRPGKPVENAFIESFNGTLRRECLDAHWFESLAEARRVLASWRQEYNQDRPHSSLGGRTPAELGALRALPAARPPRPEGPQLEGLPTGGLLQ